MSPTGSRITGFRLPSVIGTLMLFDSSRRTVDLMPSCFAKALTLPASVAHSLGTLPSQ